MTGSAIAEIDRLFEEWCPADRPGCALAVTRGGELLVTRGYGCASVEHAVGITGDTVFRIASLSKQFVCSVVLLLEREGWLDRTDPVRRYIPEMPEYGTPILVRDLMNNTSGLRDVFDLLRLSGMTLSGLAWPARRSAADLLAMTCRQRAVNFAPGHSFLYSNTGFLLLTVLVQRVSGRSLRDLLDERIFRPLGMDSTALMAHDGEPRPRLASGYAEVDGRLRTTGTAVELGGEGGLVSSANDLLKWIDALTTTEEWQGLRAELAAPAVLASGTQVPYGYGLMVEDYRGRRAIGHSGLLPGFRSNLLHLPELSLTVICLANTLSLDPYIMTRQVADLVAGDDFPLPPPAEPAADLIAGLEACGPFVAPEGGPRLRFGRSGRGGGAAMWRYIGPLALRSEDPARPQTLRVCAGGSDIAQVIVDGPSDAISGLRLRHVDGSEEPYHPAARVAAAEGADGDGDYLGRFVCFDLDTQWLIEPAVDGLHLRIEGPDGQLGPLRLQPIARDGFELLFDWAGWVFRDTLRFKRDSAGLVCGLEVDAARVRGLSFSLEYS